MEATLRLRPVPATTAVAVCTFPSLFAAADAVASTLARGVTPSCAELLDQSMVETVNGYSAVGMAEAPTVLFKFSGSEGEVEEQSRCVCVCACA